MLTRQGYILDKSKYNKNYLKVIKDELTVEPFVPDAFKFGKQEDMKFKVYKESDEYLAIPKHYGCTKIGKPKKVDFGPRNKAKIKFKGDLREYQKKIMDIVIPKIKKDGGGLISIPPGRGKTVLAIYLASKLKCKTLVLVHKTFLMEQWEERIRMFTNSSVGKIQRKTVDVDHDFVIGMIQSISMKDDYDLELFEMFDFVITDECFPNGTFIHTDQGSLNISTLYEKWRKKQELPNILSFNKRTNEFEYKKMTHAWRKERKDLIKIKMSKKVINCTPEHKILTLNGYKEANKLKVGDLILSKYDTNHIDNIISPKLNKDQLQIIYGSYLGDGHIDITKKGRYRLRVIHCEKQKEYCEWKANMFNINKLRFIEKNGYSQKPAYSFQTKIFDIEEDIPKNTKNVPKWLLDKIDERAIAIWYMDDGSILKKKLKNGETSTYCCLHTNNFNYETHENFVTKFKQFNINCDISKSKNKYYYLRFNKENTQKLLKLVESYIHESMNYKINNVVEKYNWDNNFENYGTLRVTDISYYENKGYNNCKKPYVYDIEVVDNHNFTIATKTNNKQKSYIDGPVVSNCHHLSSKVFSRCLLKMTAPYMLGLSATFKRKDRLDKVFRWHVGDILYVDSELVECKKMVERYFFTSKYDTFKEHINRYNGRANLAKMYTELIDIKDRKKFVRGLVKDVYQRRPGTKALFLSQRIDDIKQMKKYLDEKTNIVSAEFHGQVKADQRDLAKDAELILSVYQFASEALDIPDLNCLFMVQSKRDLEQVLGRIFRRQKGEYDTVPLVIDIVDKLPSFMNQARHRMRKYKKDKFIVKDYIYDPKNKKITHKVTNDYSAYEEVDLDKDEFLD